MKLTTDELSRRVAEHIEPMPTYRPIIKGHIGLSILVDSATPSVTATWCFVFASGEWQPRDMRGPAMTVMLQERLLRQSYTWSMTHWTGDRFDHIELDGFDSTRRWPVEDYARAVVEAYALVFGLATEEEL